MVFADGSHLETDMIVFSAGIRPRTNWPASTLPGVGARGGVAIDDHCRTSDHDIYAIGECAAWNDQTFGLVAPATTWPAWPPHIAQADAQAAFAGADMRRKLKLMGVDVASIGDARAAPRLPQLPLHGRGKQVYKKIVVSEDGKRLLGAVLMGNADEYGTCCRWPERHRAARRPGVPDPAVQRWQAKAGLGVDALPTAPRSARATTSARARSARRWATAPPTSAQ